MRQSYKLNNFYLLSNKIILDKDSCNKNFSNYNFEFTSFLYSEC